MGLDLCVHATRPPGFAGAIRSTAGFLVVEKRDQDDDRDRNAKKPKQNPTAHFTLLNATLA
jgi:hypothetical protein